MASNPTLLVQPIAENGTKNAIPATTTTPGAMSQDQGFPAETSLPLGAGGVAPSREDFNGAFNLLSAQNFMTQKGWVYKFDAGQAYYAGCVVRDETDGKLYECINDVAAGGSVPSADAVNWKEFGVDTSAFANTDLSNLTATGEQKLTDTTESVVYEDGFAVIYPNGGSEGSPANVAANSRYVESNPFSGYIVYCVAEIFYNNQWGRTGWASDYVNGAGYGLLASQLDDDNIVIQSGSSLVMTMSGNSGNPFSYAGALTMAPCRVKVWKIGKVANS